MVFELDIDLYFWMIDRGDFEDDQRNKVMVEQQKVQLFREHSQKVENGFYIGKLMHVIRKTIIKKSRKPFTLDPILANLKDSTQKQAKDYNWTAIIQELKKFNIKYTKDQKNQIVDGKHSIINDILKKLQDYDQNLLVFNPLQAPAGSIGGSDILGSKNQPLNSLPYDAHPDGKRNGKLDINSEINYGLVGKSTDVIERERKNLEAESNVPPSDSEYQFGAGVDRRLKNPNSKSSAILDSGHYAGKNLEKLDANFRTPSKNPLGIKNSKSIIQLHRMDQIPDSTNFEKSIEYDLNDFNNQFDQGYESFDGPAPFNGEPDQDANNNNDLLATETAATFIIASLRLTLNMRANQIGGLLANQNKYLILLCIKGMKNGDFSKLMNWYKQIINNIGHLIYLLQNEVDQVGPTMSVLRCGLFSKDADVSNLACRAFTKMATLFNENSQSSITDVKHSFWEWLTIQKKVDKAAARPPSKSPARGKKAPTQKTNQELDSFMVEAGLKAFIRAHKKHRGDVVEQFSAFLTQVGQNNYVDLFTNHLRLQSLNNYQYLSLVHDIYQVLISTQNGRKAFIDSGVLNVIIDMCYQLADNNLQNTTPNGFNSEYNKQIKLERDERQIGLVLLVDIWKSKPEFIQSKENGGRMSDAILGVLKKGARDKSKSTSILSWNLMANLLDSFAQERNSFAPTLYKAMTFILIDLYHLSDLRQEMLNNVVSLFKVFPSIPIQILCDPLFKQIKIFIDRQEFADQSQNKLLQPNNEFLTLNTTDFQFFMHIATHQKLNAQVAASLLEIVLEISRNNIIFTRMSLKLLMTILNRFENNTLIFQFCQNYIHKLMKILIDQDVLKTEIYNDLMSNPQTRVHSKKKSLAAVQSSVNVDGGGGFSSIAGKNSKNIKFKSRERASAAYASLTSDKTKGIVSGGGGIGNVEFIDDSDLQAALNPKIFQEQSSRYMQLRTKEKMIVNQLQCLIGTGIKVLVEYIREQLLETYIKIEKKHRFKNKGILYLLNIFEKDVTKMLQYYYKEQNQARIERARTKKIEQDKLRKRMTSSLIESDLEETMNNRAPSPPEIGNLRSDQIILDSLTAPQIRIKNQAKPSALKGRTPIKSIQSIEKGLEAVGPNQYGTLLEGKGQQLNTVKKAQTRKLSQNLYGGQPGLPPAPGAESQRATMFGEPVPPVRALTLGRGLEHNKVQMYQIGNQPKGEVQKYSDFVRKHFKIYKAMFNKYANLSGNNQLKKTTFDDMKEQNKSMNLNNVYKFMSDFKLTSSPSIKRDMVKKLIKLINLKNSSKASSGNTELDLEGFTEFVLQIAYFYYDKMDRASVFLPLFFNYFKEISLASKEPLFQRLFEDPNATSIGDPALLAELTRQVNLDPNYQLPPGFIKQKSQDLVDTFRAPDGLRESERIALEIMDELVFNTIGVHYMYPDVSALQKWVVKPDIFHKQKKNQIKAAYMRVDERYQYRPKNEQDAARDQLSPIKGNMNRYQSQPSISGQPPDNLGSPNKRLRQASIQKRKMQSSIEPELGLALKVELAQHILHPHRENLKQSAYMLEDMLKGVEKGETDLSPRAKKRIQDEGMPGDSSGGYRQQKNRVLQDKLDQQDAEQTIKKQKDLEFRKHQQEVKRQLEEYRKEKDRQQVYSLVASQAEEQAKKRQQTVKARKKKQLYDDLEKDFIENRLPAIQQAEQQKALQRQQTISKKREDKQQNEQRLAAQTEKLRRDFEEQRQAREAEREAKEGEELQEKEKKERLNARLTNQYLERQAAKGPEGAPGSSSSLPTQSVSQRTRSVNQAPGGVDRKATAGAIKMAKSIERGNNQYSDQRSGQGYRPQLQKQISSTQSLPSLQNPALGQQQQRQGGPNQRQGNPQQQARGQNSPQRQGGSNPQNQRGQPPQRQGSVTQLNSRQSNPQQLNQQQRQGNPQQQRLQPNAQPQSRQGGPQQQQRPGGNQSFGGPQQQNQRQGPPPQNQQQLRQAQQNRQGQSPQRQSQNPQRQSQNIQRQGQGPARQGGQSPSRQGGPSPQRQGGQSPQRSGARPPAQNNQQVQQRSSIGRN